MKNLLLFALLALGIRATEAVVGNPSWDWVYTKGYCLNANGVDQNAGVRRLDNHRDYSTAANQAYCRSLCEKQEGYTGCEVIWGQGNHGCYVHRGVLSRGNGSDKHMCFMKANTQQVDFKDAKKGYCLGTDGKDQNTGVLQLDANENYGAAVHRQSCLNKCANVPNLKGCEVIWGQWNKGCYAHTKEVMYGNNAERHMCYEVNRPVPRDTSGINWSEQRGYCLDSNGHDQNKNIHLLDRTRDYSEAANRVWCREQCAQQSGMTGCEVIWGQFNHGCWVHKGDVARGNNVGRHMCWIRAEQKTIDWADAEDGYCLNPGGQDQNSAVIKLDGWDGYGTEADRERCLNKCAKVKNLQGCEVIWDQSNKGCYAHTQPISGGNNGPRHKCYKINGAYQKFNGFCRDNENKDQNDGVVKIDSLDGYNQAAAQKQCLKKCDAHDAEHIFACEMIWNQGNKGCYVHTKYVKNGNGAANHACYVNKEHIIPNRKTCDINPFFGEAQKGYCVKWNNGDQNAHQTKLQSGDFKTPQAKKACLEMCSCFPGATACEVIFDQWNRGCYVHQGEVAKGNGVDRHFCWVKGRNSPTEIVPTAPTCVEEADESFPTPLQGYCLKANGQDQNSGVITLGVGDFESPQAKKTCREMCACYPGATGCEVIWGQWNRGCYVHTQEVAKATGTHRHTCWLASGNGVCMGPTGNMWGDPHFISFDGEKYDCQGRGEFVLAESTNVNDALQVNARFIPGSWGDRVKVSRAVAFRIDPDVDVIRVSIPNSIENGCGFIYHVDNVEVDVGDDVSAYFRGKYSEDNLKVYLFKRNLFFHFPKYRARVDFFARASTKFGCWFTTNVCLTPELHGGEDKIIGVLGTPNGDKTDDWINRDGTWEPIPRNRRDRFYESKPWCVSNFCVEKEDSLFDAASYDEFDGCSTGGGDPVDDGPDIDDLIDDLDDEQKAVCEDLPEDEKFECLVECVEGGPEACRDSIKIIKHIEKVKNVTIEVLDAGEDDPDAPDIDIPDVCIMSLGQTENPACPDRPVAEYIPPHDEPERMSPGDLFYGFEFDTAGEIGFKVHDSFEDSPVTYDVYVEYRDPVSGHVGNLGCTKFEPQCRADNDPSTPTKLSSVCMGSLDEAIVNVYYVKRGYGDVAPDTNDEISECCHADIGEAAKVKKFTYKLHCGCPDATPARMLRAN